MEKFNWSSSIQKQSRELNERLNAQFWQNNVVRRNGKYTNPAVKMGKFIFLVTGSQMVVVRSLAEPRGPLGSWGSPGGGPRCRYRPSTGPAHRHLRHTIIITQSPTYGSSSNLTWQHNVRPLSLCSHSLLCSRFECAGLADGLARGMGIWSDLKVQLPSDLHANVHYSGRLGFNILESMCTECREVFINGFIQQSAFIL